MDLPAFLNNTPVALALMILGFGFLIFVHELGHFLVAKWVGVRVTQFAVGFGHALLCYRKGIGVRVGTTEPEYERRIEAGEDPANFGETEYRLNWIPLGGYVKMLGQEDLDATATSDDPRSFNRKPIWARMCVISAGVVMNAIFAVIFFIIAFQWGVDFPAAEIGEVAPDSPAALAPAVDDPSVVGLRPGDRVVQVDGREAADFMRVRIASALARHGDVIDLVVERPGDEGEPPRRLHFQVTPELDPREDLLHIGLMPARTLRVPAPPDIEPDGETARAIRAMGLRPGMTATAVDGRPIEHHYQLDRMVQRSAGRPLEVTFEDEDGSELVTVRPVTQMQRASRPALNGERQEVPHLLGLVPAARIGRVVEGRAAEGVLEAGDIVVATDGHRWPTLADLMHIISTSERGGFSMTVLRDGEWVEVTVEPDRPAVGTPTLGVGLDWATDAPLVARVLDESPFAGRGWAAGTTIERFGGREVIGGYSDLRLAAEEAGAGSVEVEYTLPVAGGTADSATVRIDEAAHRAVANLRWEATGMPPLTGMFVTQRAANPWDATKIGVEKTWEFLVMTYVTLQRLVIDRTVRVHHLRGPVGIADEGTRIAERGPAYLMWFLGLISINLAVINFLPLPIVDGGHFILLTIEKIAGKPVPPQVQGAINLVGLALLLTLALVLTYHDIFRLVERIFA